MRLARESVHPSLPASIEPVSYVATRFVVSVRLYPCMLYVSSHLSEVLGADVAATTASIDHAIHSSMKLLIRETMIWRQAKGLTYTRSSLQKKPSFSVNWPFQTNRYGFLGMNNRGSDKRIFRTPIESLSWYKKRIGEGITRGEKKTWNECYRKLCLIRDVV